MSCQIAAILSDRSDICADKSSILALSFSSWGSISLRKDLIFFSSSSLRNWWSFSNSSLILFSFSLVCSWNSLSLSFKIQMFTTDCNTNGAFKWCLKDCIYKVKPHEHHHNPPSCTNQSEYTWHGNYDFTTHKYELPRRTCHNHIYLFFNYILFYGFFRVNTEQTNNIVSDFTRIHKKKKNPKIQKNTGSVSEDTIVKIEVEKG